MSSLSAPTRLCSNSLHWAGACVPSGFDRREASPIGRVISIGRQVDEPGPPAVSHTHSVYCVYAQWKGLACWQGNLSQALLKATHVCTCIWAEPALQMPGRPRRRSADWLQKDELNQMIPSGSPPTQLPPPLICSEMPCRLKGSCGVLPSAIHKVSAQVWLRQVGTFGAVSVCSAKVLVWMWRVKNQEVYCLFLSRRKILTEDYANGIGQTNTPCAKWTKPYKLL